MLLVAYEEKKTSHLKFTEYRIDDLFERKGRAGLPAGLCRSPCVLTAALKFNSLSRIPSNHLQKKALGNVT